MPGASIKIGRNSIFHCELRFSRAGAFYMDAQSYVSPRTRFHIAKSISIGSNVLISSDCSFIDTDMHSQSFKQRKNDVLIMEEHEGFTKQDQDWTVVKSESIRIDDKAWVGLGSIVLKGVTL
jgi:acetyltransferase-like isoleucine patch superfamily enzyme